MTIHPSAIIDPGVEIGGDTNVYQYSTIRKRVVIGNNCAVGSSVYVGCDTKIGDNVRIQDKAHLTNNMVIEDDVFVGPCVVTMADRYPRSLNQAYVSETITLKKGCSVGAGAVILPGITVGEYAMIGAGSVVTKDVPPHVTVYGNPAKVAFSVRPIRKIKVGEAP